MGGGFFFLKTLCGGTSKIWAGTNGGTVKELSLSGHNHSASDITSGTLSVSRGGTGYRSLSSLASALKPYLGGGVSTTTLFSKTYTQSDMNSVDEISLSNIYFDFIMIRGSGNSTSVPSSIFITINNSNRLGTSGDGTGRYWIYDVLLLRADYFWNGSTSSISRDSVNYEKGGTIFTLSTSTSLLLYVSDYITNTITFNISIIGINIG